MILADVSFTTESMVVVSGLLATLAGAVTYIFNLLLASKDKQISEMTSSRDSYKEMTHEAVANVETVVNRMRAERGEREFKKLAEIVPEHASPVLESQKQTAELQSLRARLVAATLNLDLPAREASRPATEAEEKEKE